MTNSAKRQSPYRSLSRHIEFTWYRAIAELHADTSRGLLGFAWWIIDPLLYMSTFYIIFGLVMERKEEHYVPFLLSGLVAWKWFASSIQGASTSISRNKSLIYQAHIPKITFPLTAIISSTIRFIFIFLILLAFLVASGAPVGVAWVFDLPVLLSLQIALMLGLGMTLSAIEPFIPDIKFLVDNGMALLFFLSGIFFKIDSIPEPFRSYLALNPIAAIIHGYREILIYGRHIDWEQMLLVAAISLSFLVAGWTLLKRWDRVYAKKALT